MELTPQLLAQIDFSEKFRGYDPEEVDAFLDRVIKAVAEFEKALADTTDRAERAEAELRTVQSNVSAVPVAVAMSEDEEASQAMSTLVMAKRTADAAIADARREGERALAKATEKAQELEGGARTEADRVLGQARIDADAMTAAATEKADAEFAAQRDRILSTIGELESSRISKAGQLSAIETRIEEYRNALDHIHGSLTTLLDDPDVAIRPPIQGLNLNEIRQAAPVPVPAPEPAFEPEPTLMHTYETAAEPVAAAPIAEQPHEQSWDAQPVWDAPQPTQEAVGDQQPVVEEAAGDSWGPGSWSDVPEVGSTAGEQVGADDSQIAEHHVDSHINAPVDGEAGQVFNDFPSEGLPVIGQDRYTRDLDQAVNNEGPGSDDAMTAFFEGDDEATGRRFGRRR